MTVLNYYRWSLLLPILVSVLAFPSFSEGDDLVAQALVYSLGFFVVPYVIWAIYALRRLREINEAEARELANRAPFHMALLTFAVVITFGIWTAYKDGAVAHFDAITTAVVIGLIATISAGVAFVFGVFWTAYVTALLWLLKRSGWVWSAPGETAA